MFTCVGVLCERVTVVRFTAAHRMQACGTVTSAHNGSLSTPKKCDISLIQLVGVF